MAWKNRAIPIDANYLRKCEQGKVLAAGLGPGIPALPI